MFENFPLFSSWYYYFCEVFSLNSVYSYVLLYYTISTNSLVQITY